MRWIVAVLAGRFARRTTVLAWLLGCAALGGCAWLDLQQRQGALRPTPGRPPGFEAGSANEQARFHAADQRWTVQVPAADAAADTAKTEDLALWWLPHRDPDAPTLLYLHGTFRNLYQNLSKIDALRQAGFAVLAVDYRGWCPRRPPSTPTRPRPGPNSCGASRCRAGA
jgi:uncharacterized protein